jgi:sec-independent protein translocase protein TatA
MGPIGLPELAIVLVVVLLIFGPKRLPGIGKSLGSGMREFKEGISGKADPDADEDDDGRPQLAPTQASDEARAAQAAEDAPRS